MDADDRKTEDMNEVNLNEEHVNREDLDIGDTDLRDSDAEDCDVEFEPIEQPYKNVISLSFERSRMSQSTLQMILEATPKLQKLKYESCMHTSVMGEFEGYLDCEQMNTALETSARYTTRTINRH